VCGDKSGAHQNTEQARWPRQKLSTDAVPLVFRFAESASEIPSEKQVISWVNFEWERLRKNPELKSPFRAMKILSPRVPYQDSTWDCSVFACRYAYSVYQLRDRVFPFKEMQLVHGEIDMITNGPEFDFGMEDIARIRLEMKT
jgi:hypothetical protein